MTADRYGHLYPSLEAALTIQLDEAYTKGRAVSSLRAWGWLARSLVYL